MFIKSKLPIGSDVVTLRVKALARELTHPVYIGAVVKTLQHDYDMSGADMGSHLLCMEILGNNDPHTDALYGSRLMRTNFNVMLVQPYVDKCLADRKLLVEQVAINQIAAEVPKKHKRCSEGRYISKSEITGFFAEAVSNPGSSPARCAARIGRSESAGVSIIGTCVAYGVYSDILSKMNRDYTKPESLSGSMRRIVQLGVKRQLNPEVRAWFNTLRKNAGLAEFSQLSEELGGDINDLTPGSTVELAAPAVSASLEQPAVASSPVPAQLSDKEIVVLASGLSTGCQQALREIWKVNAEITDHQLAVNVLNSQRTALLSW